MEADADLDLEQVRRLVRKAIAAVNRMRWRSAMLERATRVRIVLRGLAAAAGLDPGCVVKAGGGWRVETADHALLATLHSSCPARTIEQLAAPLPLEVHRPTAFRLERVYALRELGYISLALDEVAE